jgi:cobalamin biosynthesis Mg chelatase CobN
MTAEKELEGAVNTQKEHRMEAKKAAEEERRTAEEKKTNSRVQSAGTAGTKTEEKAPNIEASDAAAAAADDAVDAKEVEEARGDLEDKEYVEKKVNDTDVHTRLVKCINRELDLLLLVLLAGSLGSFLHLAQSYSEFVGNRTLKSSWAWWYSLGPFIGAGLALVFYAAIRGGVMAVSTGSNAKASELNPFGLVSVAAMVGMFSKPATIKLGEVFDTLFKSDKAKESKDPVVGDTPPPTPPGGKPTASGTGSATGAK